MSQPINIVVQLTGLFATVSVPAVQLPSNEGGGPVTWEQVTGKPSTFPPSAHQHVMDDVQGLINALAGKAASIHTHQIADIIGLALALMDKANVSDLQNKADLVGGVIPTSQIPAAAITEFLGDVNSEAAMLALVGQKGDWCIRTDQNRTYFIVGDNGSVLANWRFIETPASPVTSVNGQVGVIVLGKSDVGLPNVDNTSDMAKPVSTAQAAELNQKAPTVHTHTAENIQDFNDAVQVVKIDGLQLGTNQPINSSDSILTAFAKLQAQLNVRVISNKTTRIVLVQDSPAVTGTTANSPLRWVEIPADTYEPGDIMSVTSRIRKTGASGTATQRFYQNTSPTLTGANILGLYTLAPAGILYQQFNRDLVIKSSTVTEVVTTSSSVAIDETMATGAATQYNVNWSVTQYIGFYVQPSNTGDSFVQSSCWIEKITNI
jgi:hypothetical protein